MQVSVVISFHNDEKTLGNAIRSVFAQTFKDWELILVDDGSSDGSLAVARTVQDDRVKVVSDGINRKLAYRLNQAVQLARGEYFARMDADDLMHPERLERQVQYLDDHPAVALVGTGMITIDAAYNPLGARGLSPLDTRPKAALKHGILLHPTVTGRVDWFRNNPYDETFSRLQDRDLWCRTHYQNVFAHLCKPLYYYLEKPQAKLESYLQSCLMERKVLKKYGPSIVGRHLTVCLLLRSYMKGEGYRILTVLGLRSIILKARNSPLSEEEQTGAKEVIATILQTPVPGLPSSESLE